MQKWRRWLIGAAAIGGALSLVPFALIASARTQESEKPRIHPIQDMDNQPKYKTQSSSPLFADGRAMRPVVPGTVARGDLQDDPAYYRGVTSDEWTGDEPPWVTEIPVPVTRELVERGRERYEIFCSTCHGLVGAGDGPVAVRALEIGSGTWVPPTPFHSDALRERPVGSIYNTIARGVRTMPAYGTQIPVEDRWAIVAYVRALQRSQYAPLEDVPEQERDQLP